MFEPKNDQEFTDWFESHPSGFFLNTYLGRERTPVPHKIHDPGFCPHYQVHEQWRKNMATGEYPKFCFDTFGELEQWLAAHPAPAAGNYPPVTYAPCMKQRNPWTSRR